MRTVMRYICELLQGISADWDRFWFSPTDPATLGVLRILTGLMLLYTHAVWSVDLDAFLGPNGQLSSRFAWEFQESHWVWSHLYVVRSTHLLWLTHAASLIVFLLFTLGLWTRWTSLLACLLTISYAHRAAGSLFGLDQINGFLVLYLAVGPSGAAYSLDEWLHSNGERRAGWRSSTLANIAQRLIQVHMCTVYVFAGFGKLLGTSWWAGTALWGVFANLEYQTLDMTWVASHPLLVNALTQIVLVWEVSYVVMVWPLRWRPLVLAMAVPLHLGIAICMGMTTFGLIMLVGNMSFLPGEWLRCVIEEIRRGLAGQGSRSK